MAYLLSPGGLEEMGHSCQGMGVGQLGDGSYDWGAGDRRLGVWLEGGWTCWIMKSFTMTLFLHPHLKYVGNV